MGTVWDAGEEHLGIVQDFQCACGRKQRQGRAGMWVIWGETSMGK